MFDNTIIGAAFQSTGHLKSILSNALEATSADCDEMRTRLFKIRAADSAGRRSSASILIDRMYSWRGYDTHAMSDHESLDRITLVASDGDATIGTMSVGFDGGDGLLAEALFPEEVAALRQSGNRICEFTKLAMERQLSSKQVLASLFHVAYIYAYRIRNFDCLMIEVNPRHVRYYERLLGFEVLGTERHNRRVNAPAVLMRLKFSHTADQIGMFGGRPQLSATQHSLYPYAFSVAEEAGIVARLKHSDAAETRSPSRARVSREAGLAFARTALAD